MNRRSFTAGLLASGALGACSSPGTASGAGVAWGTAPSGSEGALLPPSARPKGIMEVFLLGGMTQWETFYTVPEFGQPRGDEPGQQWWNFQANAIPTLDEWLGVCGLDTAPLLQPYSLDAAGVQVNLGPFVRALRDRPDLLARMRVWVVRHDLEPHEAAIPLVISGHPRGSARLAGLGTHVQRFFAPRDGIGAPRSYVIYQSTFAIDNNGDVASAVGLHPSSARPLSIHLGGAEGLARRIRRPAVAGRAAAHDDLVDYYLSLRQHRVGGVRAPGLGEFEAARRAMRGHEDLVSLLAPERLTRLTTSVCHSDTAESQIRGEIADEVTRGMRLATQLMTDSLAPARYVQFMEGGIYSDPEGQGYDSHAFHVERQGVNLDHALQALVANINQPGENDPSKLDLDHHHVLLNTEFGRTPGREYSIRNPHGTGSDHWPWGYVVVGFGGFVDQDRAGIVGAIGADGRATSWITPAEHRIALLSALGIWPFAPEAFAVGDVRDATSELEAALSVRERVLGYSA